MVNEILKVAIFSVVFLQQANANDGFCSLKNNNFDNLPTVPIQPHLIKIDQFTKDVIWISKLEGDMRDPVLYDRVTDNLNFDGLYKISSNPKSWFPRNKKAYFFRFGGQAFNSDNSARTLLYDTQWANGEHPNKPGYYRIERVIIDTNSSSKKTLTMIGDSITWWQAGEKFRCLLLNSGLKSDFKGSRTDIFGYGHEGEGGNTTDDVLRRIENIVVSDSYFLLIGTNDRTPPEHTLNNILLIANKLSIKNPLAQIYISTLLPRDDEWGPRNRKINELLRLSKNKFKYKIIDLERDFLNEPKWPNLLSDKIHPNENGYKLISQSLAKHLQEK